MIEIIQDYQEYLTSKTNANANYGFEPIYIPEVMFDFQKALVEWAVRKGRAAIFADCGLGKSLIELVWAENIARKTGGNVLLLTPLAVGIQMEKEAIKFGIEAKRSRNGEVHRITISNYEQLHNFNSTDFRGVICDESSILKNFDGAIKQQINIFMRKIEYRLLATATAAPNDFIELGTSSEALGYLGYMDMLGKFFKNDQNNCATNRRGRHTPETKWRLKHHAHENFWRWVTSWARAVRYPSDLGFSNDRYILPKMNNNEIELDTFGRAFTGKLFPTPAHGLKEEREERKGTVKIRCETVADIVNSSKDYSVVWCNLNEEGDLLEKAIKGSIQVSGRDTDIRKEEKLNDFSSGNVKCIITKPKIGAWGLNWQHCNHITYFPTHSFEQYYQSIRRCWRFGQKREVSIDLIYTKGDSNMIGNLKRKQKQADEMFSQLVAEMNNSLTVNGSKNFNAKVRLPQWL